MWLPKANLSKEPRAKGLPPLMQFMLFELNFPWCLKRATYEESGNRWKFPKLGKGQ